VVIILRGALDGLATVAPVGDPDYAGLHGSIALTSDGPHAAVMLDSFFALHPAMPEFARMYREKHAAVIHAVSTPYRDRSHFDGQDVLESGFAGPGRVQSGWLNRALEALPKGERVMSGLAIGATTPLVLRGAAPTVGWTPANLPQADDDTAARLIDLYTHRDPALASALSQGLQLEKSAQGDDMKPKPGTNNAGAMRLVARGAAKLMSADDGPRIAALAFDGWDTHAKEGGPVGRLAQLLSGLDGALAEFESGLGARWRDTVVVVATEFGRTARINGTEGTDHGTGTIALLAGGAVKGGRVISDWPGLKPASLGPQGCAARSSRPRRARAGAGGVPRQRAGEGDTGFGGVGVLARGLTVASSRRTPGPITTGLRRFRRCLLRRLNERPRSMGPGA
jgi:uncharacterized protein (DUF1501 family)